MNIKIEAKKGATYITLKGELDHHEAGGVRKIIEEFISKKGEINLVFDMTELDFMDSSGIGLIVGRYNLVSPLGGKVFLVLKEGNISRIVKMSGIEKFVDIFYDKKSLLDAINGGKAV